MPPGYRIGVHTSISRSLEDAALHAHRIGCNTFQIFSASPRMWRAATPATDDVIRLRRARERLDLRPLVIHDNYLINLASADRAIRVRSIAAFRAELERAILIGAEYLVAHPGSHKNQTLESGILAFAGALTRAARGIRSNGLMLLLENTAGAGSAIGSRLEELAAIRELTRGRLDFDIGYCLDTAHLLAAGYDISSPAGLPRTLAEAQLVLGLERVRVIHTNDSKAPPGSRLDRHEHIGKGYIGKEAFRRILTHPKLRDKAFILETPVEQDGDDERNIRTVKRLCRKSPTSTTGSS